MKHFYVYELINPLTGKPFYVGKGTVRVKSKMRRLKAHINEAKRIKRTHGKLSHKINTILNILSHNLIPEIKFIFKTDNEQDAFDKEMTLINFYGRRNNKTGILTNLTDGGEGCAGHKITENTRILLSIATKGENNPMYGKNHTIHVRQQISETRKMRIKNGEIVLNFDKRSNGPWKQKMIKRNKDKSIPIYEIDATTGIILNTFPSCLIAAEYYNLKKKTVWRHTKESNYKNKTLNNRLWRQINDPDIKNGKLHIINIENLEKI